MADKFFQNFPEVSYTLNDGKQVFIKDFFRKSKIEQEAVNSIISYDVFELVDGSYKFKTRTHDEHLNFKGGKISTWEIEGYANDLLKTVKGCGDHTYVFPMKGLDGHHRHGLIYSGSVPVNDVKERLSGLISYKRPNAIYRVSDDFWATDIKVSRGRMAKKIDQQRKYIIEQC